MSGGKVDKQYSTVVKSLDSGTILGGPSPG